MKANPFTSETYRKIWSKHFRNSEPGINFDFISNVSFLKQGKLPVYINLGNNLTEGITYAINENKTDDYSRKVFLIKDIPDYYQMEEFNPRGSLKLKKPKQYEGYRIEIEKYETFDHFYNSKFKAKRRQDLRRSMNRLNTCFNITYKMYHNEIEKTEFDFIFQIFYKLLEKRYTNKQERCGEIENPKLWPYYSDLAYKLINEQAATLFVIYDEKTPIAISFNYLFNKISIGAITVIDIDYLKFYLGHIMIYKQVEWSFNNKIKIFDFTEGDFEYKRRWSSNTYIKHHHILYDSSSLKSRIISSYIEQKFNLKRNLRDKKVLKKYHDYKYILLNIFKKKKSYCIDYNVLPIKENIPKKENLASIDISDEVYIFQRKAILGFLYKYPQPIKNIRFFKHKFVDDLYFGFGELNTFQISKGNVLDILNK